MNWTLRVEVHLAVEYSGRIHIDDPDGIVQAADWVPKEKLDELLVGQQLWLREPLLGYVNGDLPEDGEFRYRIAGKDINALRVERV